MLDRSRLDGIWQDFPVSTTCFRLFYFLPSIWVSKGQNTRVISPMLVLGLLTETPSAIIPQKPTHIIHFTLHWPSIPVFAASFFHNTLDCPTCSVHAVHVGIWMCPALCDPIYLRVAYNSACYPLSSLKLEITLTAPSLRPDVLTSSVTHPILIPRSTQSSV